MANNCYFEMVVQGSEEGLDAIVHALTEDYDYNGTEVPEHDHFARIFVMDIIENDGDTLHICGNCAWSVSTCMTGGEHTYYNDRGENTKFTTLENLVDKFGIKFEIISIEEAMVFSEHIVCTDGKVVQIECESFEHTFGEDILKEDVKEIFGKNVELPKSIYLNIPEWLEQPDPGILIPKFILL